MIFILYGSLTSMCVEPCFKIPSVTTIKILKMKKKLMVANFI